MSLLCAALITFSSLAAAEQAAPRRLGHLVIPDLRATAGRIEQMAAVLSPGTLPPGTLTLLLGAQLGDPGLSALGRGPVVATFHGGASPAAPPSVALFVPTSSPEPYEQAMKKMGFTVTRAPGLVMASPPRAAPPNADDYHRIEGQPFSGDLRLSLHVVDVMEAYGSLLRSGLEAMAAGLAKTPAAKQEGGPPPAVVARLLQLELRALMLLLEQTESMVVDTQFQADAVVSETAIGARPGTALAELTSHGPAPATSATAFLTRPALMAASYQLDAARVSAFMGDLVRRSAADPSAASLATPELQALIDQWGRAFTGEAAVAMQAGAGAQPLAAEIVLKLKDEAAALAFMEKGVLLFAPGGAWASFYSEMGVPLRAALQKNVRRHAGLPVHRFQMKPEPKGKLSEAQAQMALFVRDMDLAFSRGYLLAAQDPRALDALIDRVGAARPPAPFPLQAARAFGEGAQMYVDYDVFGLLRLVSGAMPSGGAPNPFAGLPATEASPLLYAAWLSDERLRVGTRLPLQPFADLIKAFKKDGPAQKTTAGGP